MGIEKNAGYYSMELGAFTLTSLHDGATKREVPPSFIRNAEAGEAERALTGLGNKPGEFELSFNPLLVETGSEIVLIDTGHGPKGAKGTGKSRANLAAYGVAPEEVTIVLISHFHGDHMNGLFDADGGPAYPNARVVVPEAERAFWSAFEPDETTTDRMKNNHRSVLRILETFGNRLSTVGFGEEVVPGILSVDARGHSPGMSAFRITSEGQSVLYAADVTNNPQVFARFAHFIAAFDHFPEQMLETRQRVLGEMADTGEIIYFFHASFPAFGYVTRSETGFDFRPATWYQG